MAKELVLMKGNQAIAEAAIRCGADGYFGYPITPQSEVLEHLMAERPYDENSPAYTGMTILQAESELASINMVYAGAAAGKRVMTSSSSPGFSLMQEGLSYIAGAELPAVCVNVVRGGPGLEEPSNLHSLTISRQPRAAVTVTTVSSPSLLLQYRRCMISLNSVSTWLSNTAIRSQSSPMVSSARLWKSDG